MLVRKGINLLYSALTVCWLLLLIPAIGQAQNLNGEKIQVSSDNLTVLKFNGVVTNCELGQRGGFIFQVRDYDNSVVIKTLVTKPVSTNLIISEGKRTHYFIVQFVTK